MADDSKALVKYEPKPLALSERALQYAEKKRQELEEALERGDVAEPISLTAVLVSLAASAIATTATALITSALTPNQRLFEERGRRTGELVINSELGILIPEVYFGALSDGYGGSWVPGMVGWTSGIRKHVSTTTTSSGGGKFGGGGSTTEVRETTYDLDWLIIWANKGPYRVLRTKANADIIYDLYGERSSYEGEAASSYTAPFILASYDHASGGREVTLQAGPGTADGGIVEWNTVQSNGAATRQLTIYYRTSANTVPVRVNINGGADQDFTLPATNETYLGYTIPVALNDGVNTVTLQNRSPTFNLGVDKIYVFPGHSSTSATGVLEPTAGPDAPYVPDLPPDPKIPYGLPFARFDGLPDEEPTGGHTGTFNHGGNAGFAIYPGNTTQLPDPTYEAAIDAQFGAGSSPAYRGRCYEVDSNFYLTRWGGAVPNRTALIEHETIKNLAQMCAFMCSRVGMESTDYDFSLLETITPRGLRIMGGKFEAREPMLSAEIPYDVIYAEQEGVLIGKPKFPFTSVATLTDKDFAWSDDEEPTDGPLSLIDVIEPNEIDLPRRVDVKYVDLDRDGEPGLQGYSRQVTEGEESVTLDLQWTFTKEEAQALAQKEVYRRHVEKPCRYFLSWEHLWINVGDVFTASLSDGFTYTILHTKDSGGIGIRECEGTLLDEPVFDQSAVVDPYGYEQPVVLIPAMTISLFLDTPLLRDGDETVNNGVGFYWVGTPRTNDTSQVWTGTTLFIQRNDEWFQLAQSSVPGTIGSVVSVTGLSTDISVFDRVGVVTVDLYGDTATLESVAEDDLHNDANGAIIGDMVFQFATATQVGGHPNRWQLSVLLLGRKGTEHHVSDDFTEKRFVLLDSAVQFVPASFLDLNLERNYAAVTSGQSLDDAAIIPFTWTGAPKQPYSTIDHKGTRDSGNDLLIEITGRTRLGGGLRSFQAGATNEEIELYKVQILNSGSTTLPSEGERILEVIPGMQLAAVLLSSEGGFLGCDHNTFDPVADSVLFGSARTHQEIHQAGNFLEGTLQTDLTGGGFTVIGLQNTGGTWKGATNDLANSISGGVFPSALTGDLATFPYLVIMGANGSLPGPFWQRFYVYEYGTQIFTASDKSGEADYDPDFGWTSIFTGPSIFRVKFNLVGSSVRIQKTHSPNVPFTPVITGSVAPVFPLFGVVSAGSGANPGDQVIGTVITCNPFPKTIYSAAQQAEDGFTPGDPIQMDIWQQSKLIGPGPKTRVTL